MLGHGGLWGQCSHSRPSRLQMGLLKAVGWAVYLTSARWSLLGCSLQEKLSQGRWKVRLGKGS